MRLITGGGIAVALSGCYVEVGGGLYPRVHTSLTTPQGDASNFTSVGWSLLFQLGFYLDVPLAFARTGVGLGWSPDAFGGEPVFPGDGPRVTVKEQTVRADVIVPYLPFERAPMLQLRVTGEWSGVSGLSYKQPADDSYTALTGASGRDLFLGASLGAAGNGHVLIATIGYEHVDASVAPDTSDGASIRGHGIGFRFLYGWTPGGYFFRYYTPEESAPQERGNAGCGYASHCDPDGNCTTQWTCP